MTIKIAVLLLVPALALVLAFPQSGDLDVQQLTPHAYLIGGSGANSVVIEGDDGLMLVDCKPPALTDRLKEVLATHFEGRSIRYLVYTHHHRDITEGGPRQGGGAVTIAHSRAHQRLLEAGHPGAEIIFATTLSVNLRPFTVSLYHKGPGHTDGDSTVYLHEERVLVLGDLASPGRHPVILPEHGASIREWLRVLRTLQRDFLDDEDLTVVPAHGPPGSMEMVAEQIAYLQDLVDAMEEAHRHGLTLSEARREAATLRDKYSHYKGNSFERNLEVAYREIGG
jgi:glyoxylase-like metal-dependent hydrolase (beta-lactamase superfamily II)